jgi:hypothetical protein
MKNLENGKSLTCGSRAKKKSNTMSATTAGKKKS